VEAVDHRDDRDDDLREKFRARLHTHDVVPHADEHDERRTEEQPEEVLGVVRAVEERGPQREADRHEKREGDPEIDRDPTDAGLGLRVHPAFAHGIERADPQRELADLRRREVRRHERGERGEDVDTGGIHALAAGSSVTPASRRSRSANGSA